MRFFLIYSFFFLHLFSSEKKQLTNLEEIFGLWEISKVLPSSDPSISQFESNKISISKDRIQILEENSLLPKDCDKTNLVMKPNALQKFSKFSQIKDLVNLKQDEKINLLFTSCNEIQYSEFVYIPKLDSIGIYTKSKSDLLLLAKKISNKPIFTLKQEPKLKNETVYETISKIQSNFSETDFQPSSFYYTDKAVDAIKQLESYRDYVYLDGNRNPIFGYGHLVPPHELEIMKEKYGYEFYEEGTDQKFFQESSKKPNSEERFQIIETYLRQDLDIILRNMKKNIKVSIPQSKIDAIVIYLFWRGSYANNKEVKEFYDLVNSRNNQAVADFITNRMKKDSSGQDIPFLGGHYIRHRNTAKLYLNGTYHQNWLIDNP